MKIIGITQARISSSRLPKKVLLEIKEKTLLEYHLERAKHSKLVTEWIVATTTEIEAEKICLIANKLNIISYQGSLDDVLDRFYQCLIGKNPDYVVRITSDCPLIDASLIDESIAFCIDNQLSYFCNQENSNFPDGLDVEVFSYGALENAWKLANIKSDREHVTPFIRRNTNYLHTSLLASESEKIYAKLRMTVDELVDFQVIKKLIESLGADKSWKVYADYLIENTNLQEINQHIFRNEGYMNSKLKDIKLRQIENFTFSTTYREQIHDLIPGGAHTYSKGDDQFPLLSPAAIAYGKGSHLWDIDGNEYLDCSMGLSSVSLGHGYEPVLNRVKQELERGVNFQRPSVLEKEMAEKFLALVPQHDMIKFAKNGSIVTSAAVKLARAKTGRKLVALATRPFYSYDDWFIGTTACNKGVPDEITNLSVQFNPCDIDSLENLFETYPNQIACVITEPETNICGNNCTCTKNVGDFLREAIDLTHKHGALFIVDEMVTGFKTALPGSITKYSIKPDMATWGKGIANGFSFCALTGTRDVMELGGIRNIGEEKVFLISTTHGGETHAMAAALASIKEFEDNSVIEHNQSLTKKLIELCSYLLNKYDLSNFVQLISSEWMPTFIFKDNTTQVSSGYRTLFMQEMIKRGVLFQGAFIPCFSHNEDDIWYFAKAFEESLVVYAKALQEGYEKYLIGMPAKPVFRKFL